MPRLVSKQPDHYAHIDGEVLEATTAQPKRILMLLRTSGVPVNFSVLENRHYAPRWAFNIAELWPWSTDSFKRAATVGAKLERKSVDAAEAFADAMCTLLRLSEDSDTVAEFLYTYDEGRFP